MVDGRGRAQQKAATRRRLLRAAVEVFGSGLGDDHPRRGGGGRGGRLQGHALLPLRQPPRPARGGGGARSTAAAPRGGRPSPGLAPFLDAYLAAQRLPETRLVWEIGDVLSVEGRSAPTAAYRHLMDHIAQRLAEDGFEPDRGTIARRHRRPRDAPRRPPRRLRRGRRRRGRPASEPTSMPCSPPTGSPRDPSRPIRSSSSSPVGGGLVEGRAVR